MLICVPKQQALIIACYINYRKHTIITVGCTMSKRMIYLWSRLRDNCYGRDHKI